jgi:hypothetical protein
MLFLHEVHEVLPGREGEFEAAFRESWMPLLARNGDARLLWYWHHVPISSRAHNVITITAVRDAAAWGRLADSLASGELRGWQRGIDTLRRDVDACMLVPTRWSELQEVDFAAVPASPANDHELTMYVEDTVWPPVLDDYVEFAGEHWYRPAAAGTGRVRARISMPAFFQVAHGTGRRPEVYLVQKLLDPPEMFVRNLLGTDYPPEMKAPDHYFVRGLKVRDQWESKILRTARWSPFD